jgi:hypothetical protein
VPCVDRKQLCVRRLGQRTVDNRRAPTPASTPCPHALHKCWPHSREYMHLPVRSVMSVAVSSENTLTDSSSHATTRNASFDVSVIHVTGAMSPPNFMSNVRSSTSHTLTSKSDEPDERAWPVLTRPLLYLPITRKQSSLVRAKLLITPVCSTNVCSTRPLCASIIFTVWSVDPVICTFLHACTRAGANQISAIVVEHGRRDGARVRC